MKVYTFSTKSRCKIESSHSFVMNGKITHKGKVSKESSRRILLIVNYNYKFVMVSGKFVRENLLFLAIQFMKACI